MTNKRDDTKLRRKARIWFTEKRIRRIRSRVIYWGRCNFQSFPWRAECNPWLTFVAELLLQRTRASQVEPVFSIIQKKYSTPSMLLKGGDNALNELTNQLGLHRRGMYIFEIAELIMQSGNKINEDLNYLITLPGVGIYTAAAWLSLHRGIRAVIVDSNVSRWLSRMSNLPYNRDVRGIQWMKEISDRLTPNRFFRDYNYAVLDFTMIICRPTKPCCEECPLQSDCKYFILSSG